MYFLKQLDPHAMHFILYFSTDYSPDSDRQYAPRLVVSHQPGTGSFRSERVAPVIPARTFPVCVKYLRHPLSLPVCVHSAFFSFSRNVQTAPKSLSQNRTRGRLIPEDFEGMWKVYFKIMSHINTSGRSVNEAASARRGSNRCVPHFLQWFWLWCPWHLCSLTVALSWLEGTNRLLVHFYACCLKLCLFKK